MPVWVWTVPLGALALLFGAFLGVQTVAMFGGDEYVQRVAGVTYAEYARQGFFQLVMVSLLVLCVIAAAVRILPSRATRILRNALLGALCVLTLVILASAMLQSHAQVKAFAAAMEDMGFAPATAVTAEDAYWCDFSFTRTEGEGAVALAA